MGVALVCGGYYELGLKYLERVKEGREKELKKYPHNNELKANTCSTYNNLSLGYSKLKKYKQALKEQLKAYTLMKDLYAQNKAQLGTNYMLITMNVSVNYYQNGDNQQALHYLEEASAIAEEMKALFRSISPPTIVVKLAKGDLLSKLSQPGAQELLKEGLEYKAGSQPNDALLLYTLKEYHSNGSIPSNFYLRRMIFHGILSDTGPVKSHNSYPFLKACTRCCTCCLSRGTDKRKFPISSETVCKSITCMVTPDSGRFASSFTVPNTTERLLSRRMFTTSLFSSSITVSTGSYPLAVTESCTGVPR